MADEFRYLIIGNSAGGVGAAEAIRSSDRTGRLAIVSDEPYPAYSRPLISEYLVEKCPLERMLYRPADFYEKNGISALLGKKVARLDVEAHTAELESGERIAWEKLLFATGGVPIIPKIKGMEKSGVFTFTTFDDARAIDAYIDGGARRAVVIGGGLIGISVTEALVKRGVATTVLELKDRVLNTILDEAGSAMEAEVLKRAGVNIITGHTVLEIQSSLAGGADVSRVVLDDGRQLPCEVVVVAIGVRPRVELAQMSGVMVNRGIVVDRRMATSHPDIYACGDAAEAYDFVYGENRLTPIWPNAYLGGRVAGFNMAGTSTEYGGGTAMNSLKYFGLDVTSAGMVVAPDAGYEAISRRSNGSYRKVVLKDGLIAGMVFIGDIEKSGIILGLMRDRMNVSDFKESLVADDFGLICLPEKIWRSRLTVSPVGTG